MTRRTHIQTDPNRVRYQALSIASSLIRVDVGILDDLAGLDGLTNDEVGLIMELRHVSHRTHVALLAALKDHRSKM